MADTYEFLSTEWIEAAHKLRDEFEGEIAPPTSSVKMNLVVAEVPFQDDDVHVHMDSSSGEMQMDLGHLDDPELTITTDWVTAKALFVDNDPQAGMQAFMQGKVKVQGDMTKLMAMQQQGAPDPAQEKLSAALQELTD